MKNESKMKVKKLFATISLLATACGAMAAAPLQVSTVDSRYLADANGKTVVPVGCNICFDRLNADGYLKALLQGTET